MIPDHITAFALYLDALTGRGGVDFHLHSTYSDGALSPEEVARAAVERGLRAFSLTDHDTVAGVVSASGAAGPEIVFVPGIELTADDHDTEVHVLGYFVSPELQVMRAYLDARLAERKQRNLQMLEKLRKLGFDMDEEAVHAYGKEHNTTIGRVHMALWLVEHGGFSSVSDAFRSLLAVGRPAYVPKPRNPLQDVSRVIIASGGVPVLAHPAQYGWCRNPKSGETRITLRQRLLRCREAGILGVECFHGEADWDERILLFDTATSLGLIRTAGSDSHGREDAHAPMYTGEMTFFDRAGS